MKKWGTAVWHGGIKDGKGAISTESGALKNCLRFQQPLRRNARDQSRRVDRGGRRCSPWLCR